MMAMQKNEPVAGLGSQLQNEPYVSLHKIPAALVSHAIHSYS